MTSIAEQEFPGVPVSVAASRRFIAEHLPDLALARIATLCVGELATNAIRHSRSGDPGGTFRVALETGPEWTRIEVTDQGGGDAPRVRPPSDNAEDGRGLQIVGSLGSGWGTAPDGGGHRVWVRIERISGPKRSMPDGARVSVTA